MAAALREFYLISLVAGLALAGASWFCLWTGRKVTAKMVPDMLVEPATVDSERRLARRAFFLVTLLALTVFFAISSATYLLQPRLWMGIFDPQNLLLVDSAPQSK